MENIRSLEKSIKQIEQNNLYSIYKENNVKSEVKNTKSEVKSEVKNGLISDISNIVNTIVQKKT